MQVDPEVIELTKFILVMGSVFLFGIRVGDFLRSRRMEKWQDRNYRLKREMWREIKERFQ